MKLQELFSDRLKFRQVIPSDDVDIHRLLSLPETDRYNTLGISADIDITRQVMEPWVAESAAIDCGPKTFLVAQSDTGEFVGVVGMRFARPAYRCVEIWYKLHKDVWGMGFATEVVAELLRYSFEELKLHRVEAGVAIENIGSIRVLEKNGLTREGIQRQKLPLVSGWSDCVEFGILESEYRAKNDSVS